MVETPLVSVCVITYNHVKFIKQAIEGVLSQNVNFKWELIIADDFSTDGTRDIVLEYKKRYPDLISLILQKENVGAAKNWFDLITSPRGKYIAYFEADDYWCNSNKLERQVAFLESNLDYSICFHNCKIITENSKEEFSFSNSATQKEVSGFDDLAKGEYIYTSTCVFRNANLRKFPIDKYNYLNNYTLDLHNAQFGKIKYINEVMSVYRKHSGGIWSMVSRSKTLINQLPVYEFYLDYFDPKYRHYFVDHLSKITSELIKLKLANGDMSEFLKYYWKYLKFNMGKPAQMIRTPIVLGKSFWVAAKNLFKIKRQ